MHLSQVTIYLSHVTIYFSYMTQSGTKLQSKYLTFW